MAKYTITIKTLIDNNFDFGLESYPLFNQEYRTTLNQKILYHYYENEIGFETAELFKFYLNNKMSEIMPKYNILYQMQEEIAQNLINNVNLTEKQTHQDTTTTNNEEQSSGNTSTTSSSNSNSNNKNLFQDTPQGQISFTELEKQNYATNYTLSSNDNSDTSTSDGTSQSTSNLTGKSENFGDYLKTIIGSNGQKYGYEILKEISESYRNIDILIINELSDLFMGIL